MKAVFDTNVLLAAFLTEGVCAKLLTRARKRQFSLITCPFILHEFERILAKKFSATKQEKDNALVLITEAAVIRGCFLVSEHSGRIWQENPPKLLALGNHAS